MHVRDQPRNFGRLSDHGTINWIRDGNRRRHGVGGVDDRERRAGAARIAGGVVSMSQEGDRARVAGGHVLTLAVAAEYDRCAVDCQAKGRHAHVVAGDHVEVNHRIDVRRITRHLDLHGRVLGILDDCDRKVAARRSIRRR